MVAVSRQMKTTDREIGRLVYELHALWRSLCRRGYNDSTRRTIAVDSYRLVH